MSKLTTIAIDAMGGDNAPQAIVQGAIEALKENENVKIVLVGTKEPVDAELAKYSYDKDRVELVYTTEEIDMGDHSVQAIRQKKDSSMVVAMKMLKEGTVDAMISAGSSGALLAGGQLVVGRVKGVERAPFAPILPTETGATLLIDSGANVDASPSHLVQYAKMGDIYYQCAMGKKPTVGIVNIGLEEEKGNKLVKETFPLLKECKDINFVGSVEAREIPAGAVDVVVCDAFTGNVIVKLYEGMAKTLLHIIKAGLMTSLKSKIGALLIKKSLKDTLKQFDAAEHGGAPMLGLNGLLIKTHGNSSHMEIKNAVKQCLACIEQGITEKMRAAFAEKNEE